MTYYFASPAFVCLPNKLTVKVDRFLQKYHRIYYAWRILWCLRTTTCAIVMPANFSWSPKFPYSLHVVSRNGCHDLIVLSSNLIKLIKDSPTLLITCPDFLMLIRKTYSFFLLVNYESFIRFTCLPSFHLFYLDWYIL